MPVSAAPEYIYGDRLSPLPEDRKNTIRLDPLVDAKQLRSWEKENVQFVKEALKNVVRLPDYSLAFHQSRADNRPPRPQDPSWRGGELIKVENDDPTIVCDSSGVVGVVIIPGFLKRISLGQLNNNIKDFMRHELAPRKTRDGRVVPFGSSSNGNARGGIDKYTTDHGIFGTATYAIAWHQQAHEETNSFEPSRTLTRSPSGVHTHLRGQFLSGTRNLHHRLNHLVRLLHPRLHELLVSARPLLAQHPTVCQLQTLWDSVFLGHSVIMNRTSGEHLDSHGLRRGFDGLLAAGKFEGGDLFFKDLMLQVRFEPGTLLLFDGTSQRHSICEWTGEQRISNAFFVHRSVFEELDLSITLPDLTIQDIALNINPPAPPHRKRKRRGQDNLRRSKSSRHN